MLSDRVTGELTELAGTPSSIRRPSCSAKASVVVGAQIVRQAADIGPLPTEARHVHDWSAVDVTREFPEDTTAELDPRLGRGRDTRATSRGGRLDRARPPRRRDGRLRRGPRPRRDRARRPGPLQATRRSARRSARDRYPGTPRPGDALGLPRHLRHPVLVKPPAPPSASRRHARGAGGPRTRSWQRSPAGRTLRRCSTGRSRRFSRASPTRASMPGRRATR